MADRRTVSSTLSADVVRYLCEQGHTQAKIARMLGVTEGFISLVKSRDRSLTLDHLERLTQSLSVPLGAFLLAVTKPYAKNLKEREQKLVALATKVMESCDATSAAIMNGPRSARRAS